MLTCRPPCSLSFDLPDGEGVGGYQVDMSETYTFNTDSVLNVKSMLTSFLAGVFGGNDGSEPALKEVLWNNVKKGKKYR